jgi:protein-S-isoprenylcysteine O-methyltransferase Ste14
MILLRLYLLSGLVLHKTVWEMLKRRGHAGGEPVRPDGLPLARMAKAAKIAVLCGLVAQTMLPELLPIAADASVLRGVGVAIYTIGLLLAILGRVQLGDNWSDIESAKVGARQALVTNGIYRYVRHPIYAGDLLLLLGFELALNSWLVLGVVALAALVVRQTLREEALLVTRLAGYDGYSRRTKRFVPFVI